MIGEVHPSSPLGGRGHAHDRVELPGFKGGKVFHQHLIDPGTPHIQLLAQGVSQLDMQADQLPLRVATLEGRELRGNGEADFASRWIGGCHGIRRKQQGKRYTEVYQGQGKRPFPERPASLNPAPVKTIEVGQRECKLSRKGRRPSIRKINRSCRKKPTRLATLYS
jgi:hypothetical protein